MSTFDRPLHADFVRLYPQLRDQHLLRQADAATARMRGRYQNVV